MGLKAAKLQITATILPLNTSFKWFTAFIVGKTVLMHPRGSSKGAKYVFRIPDTTDAK